MNTGIPKKLWASSGKFRLVLCLPNKEDRDAGEFDYPSSAHDHLKVLREGELKNATVGHYVLNDRGEIF